MIARHNEKTSVGRVEVLSGGDTGYSCTPFICFMNCTVIQIHNICLSVYVTICVLQNLSFYFMDCGDIPPPVIQVQNVSFRYKDGAVCSVPVYIYVWFGFFCPPCTPVQYLMIPVQYRCHHADLMTTLWNICRLLLPNKIAQNVYIFIFFL